MRPVAATDATDATASRSRTGADPRLKPAAQEFEACLMKELLEPLERDTLFADRPEGTDDGTGNALMSFGAESLAKAMAERGGFGIARMIVQQCSQGNRAGESQ